MRNDELQAAVFRFEKSVKAGNQSLKKGKANGIPMGRAEIEFHKDMTLALTALREKAERDAAVRDLRRDCTTCEHKGKSGLSKPCLNCQGTNYANWEWRGGPADEKD